MTGLRALSRFARPAAPPEERCELCGAPIPEAHRHLVDLEREGLVCACRPCGILFERPGSGSDRYRTVPDRVLVDPELRLEADLWAAVGVPVNLAFVVRRSATDRWVAHCPGAAGTVRAEVDDEGWAALAARTALVASVEPDVEALLVHGRRGERVLDALLAPVDRCYELAGRVRRLWRGFDGGDEVRAALSAFFAELSAHARPVEVRP